MIAVALDDLRGPGIDERWGLQSDGHVVVHRDGDARLRSGRWMGPREEVELDARDPVRDDLGQQRVMQRKAVGCVLGAPCDRFGGDFERGKHAGERLIVSVGQHERRHVDPAGRVQPDRGDEQPVAVRCDREPAHERANDHARARVRARTARSHSALRECDDRRRVIGRSLRAA